MIQVDARHPQSKPTKRLVVRDTIGRGGMSTIKEAFDTNLLRSTAMKIIDQELAHDEALLRKFVEEAQINAQLEHPHIVPVYELGEDKKGTLYFTMKRVEGRTLADLLASDHLLRRTPQELYAYLQIFLKVCDALSYAHSQGVVHQDIKPENVMVGEHGAVYLMDWGIALLVDGERPSKSEQEMPRLPGKRYRGETDEILQGTPFYMSPERAAWEQVDARADVFSLGGILYEILTLYPPYLGNDTEALMELAKRGVVVPPDEVVDVPLPAPLCRIAMRAMSRDPADRYPDVAALKREVEGFMQSGFIYPRRSYEPGALIVSEGAEGEEAYIIVQGRCRVFREVDDGEQELREMGVGEVFGELAVLTGAPRAASVQAVDRVVVAVVSERYFQEVSGANFWMGRFMKTLAVRFQELDNEVKELQERLRLLEAE